MPSGLVWSYLQLPAEFLGLADVLPKVVDLLQAVLQLLLLVPHLKTEHCLTAKKLKEFSICHLEI